MKTFVATAMALVLTAGIATAGEAPKYLQETYPDHALKAALGWAGALQGEEAALDGKTRELVAIAVAAQVPCDYCVYAHTAKAKKFGATEAEIREAVAMAAYIRHWSTVLNGMAYDLDAFKAEFDQRMAETN